MKQPPGPCKCTVICSLHKASEALLEACQVAMERLTPKGNIKKDFSGHLAKAALSKAIDQAKGKTR